MFSSSIDDTRKDLLDETIKPLAVQAHRKDLKATPRFASVKHRGRHPANGKAVDRSTA
jgi:hypothetical protein